MDFEICSFIFFKFGDFKIFFEILRISNMLIVWKVILYDKIILQLREIVYIRVDYTGLFKGRFFIMIKIYSIVSNIILDFITFRIVILVNLTKRVLKIDKNIYIVTIHEYADIIYFIVGSFEMFIVLRTALAAIFEPSSFI